MLPLVGVPEISGFILKFSGKGLKDQYVQNGRIGVIGGLTVHAETDLLIL